MIDLRKGDCLELMKDIPDKSIDAIIADLPYGTTARNKWDTIIPFEPLWEEYERIIKDNGAIVLFSQQPFTTELINSNRKMFRYPLIWNKVRPVGFLNANRMPLRSHEDICVFYKKLPTYNPQMRKGEMMTKGYGGSTSSNYGEAGKIERKTNDEYYPHSILTFKSVHNMQGKVHPTQKPVELCEWLIKTYSNEGDTILDNCMGSGTTGVACINTIRKFIGMELDDKYFEIAEKRINDTIKDKQCNLF